ncbi:MAG TPA: hypothetical protein PL110_15145, partial [Candidatus Eremiobacteraeota bacterium]|nr:hypothetical protein [Candidatus Eremiobacteraeota bacterium]
MKLKIPEGYKNQCESFAFKVKCEEKFLYSSDIKSLEDIKKYMPDCRYVIIEMTHVSLEEVIDWAVEHEKTQVIISHIDPGFSLEGYKLLIEKKDLT